jgi:hypothetical protein
MTSPDRPGFFIFPVVFRGQTTGRIALFPGKSAGGPLALIFPPLLRVSGTLRRESPFFKTPAINPNKKRMARTSTSGTARIDLEITPEAQARFAAIHKALGFKTKPETFEALVFSVSAKDVLRPDVMARIESKLDRAMEILDSIT